MTIKFDQRISVGNLLTIAGGILVAIAWFVAIGQSDAKQNEKLSIHEERLKSLEMVHQDVIRISANQANQEKMLNRIIDYLESGKNNRRSSE